MRGCILRPSPNFIFIFARIVLICAIVVRVPPTSAARFYINGPALTLTLKDPHQANDDNSGLITETISEEQRLSQSSSSFQKTLSRIFNVSGLAPSVMWGVRSMGPPLPNWVPFLKSLSLTSGYSYNDSNHDKMSMLKSGSFITGNIQFGSFLRGRANINVNPTYLLKENICSMFVSVGSTPPAGFMGESDYTTKSPSLSNGFYALAKFTSKGNNILQFAKAMYKQPLPFATVSSVAIVSSFDFEKAVPSCVFAGESGTGRTTAILDLNIENPTLAVVHDLDSRNTIFPEISLHNARIMYNWDIKLRSGGSIHTHVDPTSAIRVTWTDVSPSGKWVTDFKLPLESTDGPFTADIRVKRQFSF